jgi:FKBP-type peptidyl-prolyl cis-trans isomerase (trigger factor)
MNEATTKTYEVKIKKLPRSQVELQVTIPKEEFTATRMEAIKHIGANAELPGFRKGHVPEHMLVAKVGESVILEEMAEIAIRNAYPHIIITNKLDVLGRPEIRITKLALGNPLEFTLTTAIFPEFTLPDYKKLAAKAGKTKEELTVTDAEITKTIEQILRMKAGNDAGNEGGDAAPETPLPVLDDTLVKTLGDFSSVDDFKAKLRENMLKEKERAAKDKKRLAIIEAILAQTSIELPEIIVEQELARMEDEFAQNVLRMGLTMDAYFKAVQKTKEEVKKEWEPDAKTRANTQLVVNKIAEVEAIEPDSERLKREVAALRDRYPDAPADRAEGYVRMLLTNEKVFELLESAGE